MIKYGVKNMYSLYDKYFSNTNLSSAKGKIMYDIKNRMLYGNELLTLIDELEKNNILEEKPFSREPQKQWSDKYARFLASGFASGYFSRNYLQYFSEVVDYLYHKKKRKKILIYCVIAGLIITSLIIAFY